MLAILTEAGPGGGRVIMERILAAAAERLSPSQPLYHATVSITPGIDPDDWFAVARDRMTIANGKIPDAASA